MNFVFDLDGTIVFQGLPISKKILRALKALEDGGHKIIFASARPIRDMLPVIDESFYHVPMIGGNGSIVSRNGKIVKSVAFSADEISEIKRIIHAYRATYLIDGEWDYAYTGPDDHPILQNVDSANLAKNVDLEQLEAVIKVLILSANPLDELEAQIARLGVFVHKHHNEHVLDISPRGVNKWSALKSLGVDENDYVAFGNDANDIAMFERASHTVMVGSHEQLAPLANESIALEGDFETEIANKILTLAAEY